MDIGTIVIVIIAIAAGAALLWVIVWGAIALLALKTARKVGERIESFGIDPDLRSASIRQQHERVKRWGLDS